MLVEYFNSRPASWLRPRLATALFLISAVATVALLCLGLKHPDIVRLRGEANLALVVEIPFDLLVIAFFASAVLGSLLLRAVLRLRFLAFIGLISYSLFLLHNTVLSLVNVPYFSTAIRDWVAGQDLFGVWAAFFGYTLAILAISFTVAYFSYRYVESPFLSYRPK